MSSSELVTTPTLPPTLEQLKSRECTPVELQAALVHLIELHNGLHSDINAMIRSGRIRSSREASENMVYSL